MLYVGAHYTWKRKNGNYNDVPSFGACGLVGIYSFCFNILLLSL